VYVVPETLDKRKDGQVSWKKGNEICTENDCSLVPLLGEGTKHYRWQCGSEHVEGYGNTEETEDTGKPKGSGRWGKLLDNMSGGWQ